MISTDPEILLKEKTDIQIDELVNNMDMMMKKYTKRKEKKTSRMITSGSGVIMEFQTENYESVLLSPITKLSLLFALHAGKVFEETGLCDRNTHNKTMEVCLDLLPIFGEMSDNDILINYCCDNIQNMVMDEPNMDLLLPDDMNNRYYVVIFTYDASFIIMRDEYGYMLRDAKERTQLNFTNINDIKFHLYNFYGIGQKNYAVPLRYRVKKVK